MKQAPKSKSVRTFQTINLASLALAIGLYIVFTILFPPPPTASSMDYHLSTFAKIALTITVLTPWIASWTLGVFGYIRLEQYARSIKDKASARPFRLFSRGIMTLVWSLILATLIGTIRSHYPGVHQLIVTTAIITNYLYALAPLAGFFYFWKAIRELGYGKVGLKQMGLAGTFSMLVFIVLAAAYIALTFTNPNRQVGANATITATYYLPDWLIATTITLPVIVSWALGFLAIGSMYRYQRAVTGFIYRKFMSSLSYGMILIEAGAIFLQGLQSTGSQRLLGVGIPAVLGLLYLFVFIQLFGYILVSQGAKKLTLIETM